MNTKMKQIADNADVIINGYAFSKCDLGFSIINLNAENSSAIFNNVKVVIFQNF